MSIRVDPSHASGRPHDARRRTRVRLAPNDHDLTIVIPAYNEEARLPTTLRQLARFVEEVDFDCRVLVVDDGSHDATPHLTARFGSRFSTLVMDQQGGKGRAVRHGVLQATGRIVAFTDADLPYDMQAMIDGYRLIDSAETDIIFGARDVPGAELEAARRLSRRLATRVFRSIVQLLVSGDVGDTQCGLKLFRRRAAVDIFSRAVIDGFAFDTEIVLLARRLGYRYRRIPVRLLNEYSSTLSLSRHALPMLWEVVRLWWRSLDQAFPPASAFSERDLAALDEQKPDRADRLAA
ncbi:hypothetical protein JCM19992_27710 [Thermostilla marina]